MPAAINTAANFWQQHTSAVNTATGTPLPCTITGVLTGGSRVNVTVENAAQAPSTPMAAWVERNIPYVDTGEIQPASGPFVAATGYVVPTTGGIPASGPSDGGAIGENGGNEGDA